MGKYYNESIIPTELRRNFDVYDRIKKLGIDLGTWENNVKSLAGAGIAGVVFSESGITYLSGVGKGKLSMIEDDAVITSAFVSPFTSLSYSTLRPPRTYGISLGLNF